jgi:hypothetical protein
MTEAQMLALWRKCGDYNVPFREDDYHPTFDLPTGYVAGWIGDRIYVGVSPDGEISS